MGHKTYGEEPKRLRLGEFFEWFFAAFMTFTYCIGGWLVHFGMSVWWMLGLSAAIAIIAAYYLTFTEK